MQHNRLKPNYTDVVIKNKKCVAMNCGIIAIVMDIILSIIGNS